MVEAPRGLGFEHQALRQCFPVLIAAIDSDGFERDGAANQPVMRFVYHPHRTPSQLRLDNVAVFVRGYGLLAVVRRLKFSGLSGISFHDASSCCLRNKS